MLKATRVDGVYDSDPEINANAVFYPELSFDDAISQNLKVMDATALTLARDHKLPIKVFNVKSGDLYVAIRVSENPIFEREGKDLYLESPIPFEISILGGAIKVPTLEGSISLKIPAQTQTGKIFRIKGKGASVVRDSRRGDIRKAMS